MFIPSESYSQYLAFSITVQLCYPHMLSASLFHSPLTNFLLVSTHLQEGQCSQSHKSWEYVYISCEVARHLPPHTECGQRVRLSMTASHPLSPQQQCCQRCGYRKYCILLRNLFVPAASPRQTTNKCCIFGALTVPHLANLSDHVWFAACVSG